ncbi:MAG: hypothetical protein ACRCZK_05765, partial [Oscillospiraceae bacterium]
MLFLNKNLNININNNKNYRCFAPYKNNYILTTFGDKNIYILDYKFKHIDTIETSYFYGDVTYLENDTFICGCYSSQKTELHIINLNGDIVNKFNYYSLMDPIQKDQEHFISFVQSSFKIDHFIFFSLKNSSKIFYIDTIKNKLNFIDMSSYFN